MEENKNLVHITNEKFKNVSVSDEIRDSFLSYAMSVIVSRALPDARDGLKPVHRRILHAMNDLKMYPNTQYKKSARLVGEVIGKYHPHGDVAVYESIVRMVQDFNMRYPLIQGHGNFGSLDGDSAAAMRYTEIRMSKITSEILSDIDKNTVDFQSNYDGSESEPCVLPSSFPNFLVNGTTGIAVGMATSIAPHNLNNVIDSLLALIDNREIEINDLINIIKGPDFPTGGIISSVSKIRDSYLNGYGNITVQGKVNVNENSIIIYEIPFQTNKARLIERIAELVRDKVIEGISDLRDESNKDGIRIVIELKKKADPDFILNNLYKNTNLQTTFTIHYLALVNGVPKTLNLKEMLEIYLRHQKDVLARKTNFDLKKAEKKEHILKGLNIALDNIDAIIELIKKSPSTKDANSQLCSKFELSEAQATAILEMKLQRLTGLEKIAIKKELEEVFNLIVELKSILSDEVKFWTIIKNQLIKIKNQFGDERRSEISDIIEGIEDEKLIKCEDIVILLSENDYVKKIPLEEYRSQHRGGTGSNTIDFHEEDQMALTTFGQTHDYFLFFTLKGKVYRTKGYEIQTHSKQSKGRPIINIFETLQVEEDKVKSILRVRPEEFESNSTLVFVTKKGLIKKTEIKNYNKINKNGKIAIKLRENDEIISVVRVTNEDNIIISSSQNRAIRFNAGKLRSLSRNSIGVLGIKLTSQEDKVISATTDNNGKYLLCITDEGYGKLIDVEESLSVKNRNGLGLRLVNSKYETGKLIAVKSVEKDDEIIITSQKGKLIRMSIESIVSRKSRTSKGVIIMDLRDKDLIKYVSVVKMTKQDSIFGSEENNLDVPLVEISDSNQENNITENNSLPKEDSEDQNI